MGSSVAVVPMKDETIRETINNIGRQQDEIWGLAKDIESTLIGSVAKNSGERISPDNMDCDSLLKYIKDSNKEIIDTLTHLYGRL